MKTAGHVHDDTVLQFALLLDHQERVPVGTRFQQFGEKRVLNHIEAVTELG